MRVSGLKNAWMKRPRMIVDAARPPAYYYSVERAGCPVWTQENASRRSGKAAGTTRRLSRVAPCICTSRYVAGVPAGQRFVSVRFRFAFIHNSLSPPPTRHAFPFPPVRISVSHRRNSLASYWRSRQRDARCISPLATAAECLRLALLRQPFEAAPPRKRVHARWNTAA